MRSGGKKTKKEELRRQKGIGGCGLRNAGKKIKKEKLRRRKRRRCRLSFCFYLARLAVWFDSFCHQQGLAALLPSLLQSVQGQSSSGQSPEQ